MVYSHGRQKGVGMHRLVGQVGGECEIAYFTVHHGIKADSLVFELQKLIPFLLQFLDFPT